MSMHRDNKRIISISNDGKACIWRENDLAVPDFSVQLKRYTDSKGDKEKEANNDQPLAALCVQKVNEQVIIGTFDRMMHIFDIKDFFKRTETLSEGECFSGHQSAVCAVSYLQVKDMDDCPSNGLI